MINRWVHKLGIYQFLNIIYPNVCLGCSTELIATEEKICLQCLSSFKKHDINTRNQKYIGTFLPESFVGICQFKKLAPSQQLLHKLKYQNQPKIGIILGEKLANAHTLEGIDFIIPMPIHPRKLKKRGYNQALKIAEGINNITQFPINNTVLIKTKNTIPQARKNKKERLEIDNTLFQVNDSTSLRNKHILIVDDVITTGSTLESAITPLLKIEGIKISVAVIAFT